ncbi:hypothetical protein L6164_023487 [Bauhinia variegata]|uniref:Uncharacterized protein n=1 Tax=Bauhinia variegata TaxID=167791 RepID=A0ACB9MKA5_BAUVA|nr:hypothetical protein L6164_023487 [Bauhinia variegata]
MMSETCKVAQNNISSYACRNNSRCVDTDNGYRCHCKNGYEGNPYLPKGCQDIDECDESRKTSKHNCSRNQDCRNTDGSFECFCKKGYKEETGLCQKIQEGYLLIKVVIVAGVGFIALLVGMSTIYLVYQKRKLIKLKERFFRQNGGFILQQQISKREDSSKSTTQIFTAEELKKATKNYDDSLIVGTGGYGEKAFSFNRPQEKRNLAMHFLTAFKENCLLDVIESGIVKDENKEEVMEVAVLASKCLRLTGKERPSMKEVAMVLEGMMMMNKHPWGSSNIELNLEETEYLLNEKSGIFERGESTSHQNTSIRDHVLIPLDDGR